MVAVDILPGIDVTIRINGQPLSEHEDPDEEQEDRTVTRYVQAVSGQIFDICISARKDFRSAGDALSFHIHTDGSPKAVDVPLVLNTACRTRNYTRISRGCLQGANMVKRYRFAAFETSTQGLGSITPASVKGLGSIIIKIAQIRMTQANTATDGCGSISKIGSVPEKALKGQTITHSVGFTSAVVCAANTFKSAQPIGGVPNPYVTLVFRYRSLARITSKPGSSHEAEALKAMSILQRTPSPPPLEERDYDSISRDDVVELQRQLKELKERYASDAKVRHEIKRERTDDSPRPRKVERPMRDSTQLELDDDGQVRETSTPSNAEREIIELD
ncbi:hypothetical protein LTR53_011356 [Teratosphaeriaceae sp. CCFEE 6253]|nr:hypothetical protein LTR53_011356 [Teratosphaeriaceae sp. CCFEE 6253]